LNIYNTIIAEEKVLAKVIEGAKEKTVRVADCLGLKWSR
jgi:hypothetical protein